MAESVIIHTPGILLILLAALVLEEFHKQTKLEDYLLPVLSVLICFLAIIMSFLQGASLQEISIVLCAFLALHLRGGGENA